MLALTVKIRKSQDFLAPISGSPGLKVGSPRLPGIDFWKSQAIFDSQTSLNASPGFTVYLA